MSAYRKYDSKSSLEISYTMLKLLCLTGVIKYMYDYKNCMLTLIEPHNNVIGEFYVHNDNIERVLYDLRLDDFNKYKKDPVS